MPEGRARLIAWLGSTGPAFVGGLAGGALLWLVDALIESIVFELGSFPQRLLSPGSHETTQRILVVFLVLLVAVLAHLLRAGRLHTDEELASSRARYRALLESVEDGVVGLRADGTIEYVSHAATRLVGLQPAELQGRHFGLWVHPGDREQAEAAFARSLHGSPEVQVLRLVAVDGSVREVRTSSRPLTQKGRPAGVLAVVSDLSGRRETEERLRQLSRAVEASPSAVLVTDRSGCITYVNPKFSEVTGYPAEEVLGRNPRLLKSGDMPAEAYSAMWETISAGGEWRGEFHNRRKDGSSYWESASISAVVNAAGEITHFVAVKEDVTARKLAEQALRESEEKYRLLFSRQLDAAALVDTAAGRLVEVNDAFVRMFGWSATEIACMSPTDLWASADAALAVPPEGATFPELWCRRKGGDAFPVELSAGSFQWQGRALTCYILRDITERVQHQRWLVELSTTDGLTGLANRRAFNQRLESEWRRATRARTHLAVALADIDFFKAFNDACGHLAGDDCLRRVAQAVSGVARRTADVAARWGGEELAVLLPGTSLDGAAAVAEAMRRAVEELAIPHPASPVAGVVTASFGVAEVVPAEGVPQELLLHAADSALFAAKRAGRNRVGVPDYGVEPFPGTERPPT